MSAAYAVSGEPYLLEFKMRFSLKFGA